MRTYWLGLVAVVMTAGCAHEGKLRPQAGAVALSEDGNAAVMDGQGVRLVAYGPSWKGQPGDLERHFTAMQIRLENHSGRPLSIRYAGFKLDATDQYTAHDPKDLGKVMDARALRHRPPRAPYVPPPTPPQRLQPSPGREAGPSYSGHASDVPPYNPQPCLTCPSVLDAAAIPSRDMLRLAFQEGPLEDGQAREGFLYFDQPLLSDGRATLKVKLVDAGTGEEFGMLSVPFEVR